MKKKLLLISLVLSSLTYSAPINKSTVNNNIVSLKQEAKKSQYEKIVYKEGTIYNIYGKPLNATAIKFAKDEVINNITFSDPLNWNGAIASDNQIFIKPVDLGKKSTMFVTTNKRDYYFNLYIIENHYNPVLEFVYPQEQRMMLQNLKAMQHEEESRRVKLNVTDIKEVNFNYSWKKRYDWSPTNILDERKKTYIFLSIENKDMPTFFEKVGKNEYQILIPVISENSQGQKIMQLNKVVKEGYLALHKQKINIKNKNK